MNGYKIISEIVLGDPNIDMLIIKPYLYAYISNDEIEDIKENGLSCGEEGSITAFFTRIPPNKYSGYLESHTPVKISASKLSKIKDQKVIIKPVNFEWEKGTLDEFDIEKILVKYSKKLSSMIANEDDLNSLPRTAIECSDGVIPSFCLKVLDVH